MEIITIDSEAYQNLERKINHIAEFVYGMQKPQTDRWLDSDEAAELLGVSSRTLQRLRTDKGIDYSMLRGRCRYRFYRREDCITQPSNLERVS